MIYILVAILVIALDQGTKLLILNTMNVNETIPVLENILHITYVRNFGAAFGMFPNRPYIFILATLFVLILSFFIVRMVPANHRLFRMGLAVLLGGAMSNNFIDRVRLGYVVDFIDIRIWPVFNIADIAILVGVSLIFLDTLRNSDEKAA